MAGMDAVQDNQSPCRRPIERAHRRVDEGLAATSVFPGGGFCWKLSISSTRAILVYAGRGKDAGSYDTEL